LIILWRQEDIRHNSCEKANIIVDDKKIRVGSQYRELRNLIDKWKEMKKVFTIPPSRRQQNG
jgi:hypothetical protein